MSFQKSRDPPFRRAEAEIIENKASQAICRRGDPLFVTVNEPASYYQLGELVNCEVLLALFSQNYCRQSHVLAQISVNTCLGNVQMFGDI